MQKTEEKKNLFYWLGVGTQVAFWVAILWGLVLVWVLKLDVAPFRYMEF